MADGATRAQVEGGPKEPKFIFYIGNHYSGSSPREVAQELFKHKTVHIKGHLSDTFLSMITVSFVYSTVF